MPVPTKEQLQNVIKEYYTQNFPSSFGAIDGKHCRINAQKIVLQHIIATRSITLLCCGRRL
jgi:hypothetical protein